MANYTTNQDFCDKKIKHLVGTPLFWFEKRKIWPDVKLLNVNLCLVYV